MVKTEEVSEIAPNEQSKIERRPNLRSVDVHQQLHHSFAEKYGFVDNDGKSDVGAALSQLDNTFFQSEIEKGRTINNYHRTQVITVSEETDLNPFNAEIYGIFTPFGDLKVMATMDGWLKLATAENIKKREFRYSPNTVSAEINGKTYTIPEWIECYLEHETKGSSLAREYFQEVFDNSQNHLPSWSRPARMLSHVSFIQALRRMLRISSLTDSDIISDITKEYERVTTQAKYQASLDCVDGSIKQPVNGNRSNRPTKPVTQPATPDESRGLNINLDDVEIVETEEVGSLQDAEALTSETTQVEDGGDLVQDNQSDQIEPEIDDTELEAEGEPIVPEPGKEESATSEQKLQDMLASETIEQPVEQQEPINEMTLPRNVLSMFKPMIQQVLNGDKPLESLIACGKVITDERTKIWFEQQLSDLRKKL